MQVSYKILTVNTEANCMDVEFSAEGHDTVTVGVRIPFAHEDVDQVIQSFAPMSVWFPQPTELASISEGRVGQIDVTSPAEAAANASSAQMWAKVHFERQVAAALVKFGVLQSDPTTIGVTQL